MKNRILILAMAVIAAVGMISCGNPNPAAPDNETSASGSNLSLIPPRGDNAQDDFVLTIDNVDEFITTLAEFRGREVSVDRQGVDDETVEYYANLIFQNQAYNITEWSEPAAEGDTVVMNYVGKMDGVAFEGGTANGATLTLGSGQYIPGFEEGLIGVSAGETVDLELSFPDPYLNNPDYSGKPCVFTVTVTQIIPGLSDASVAMIGQEGVSTVAEYREYVRNMLEEFDSEGYNQEVVQAVVNILVEESTFPELPAKVLNAENDSINNAYGSYASQYGIGIDEYLAAYGTTLEEQQITFAKEHIVFLKVAKELGYSVSEAEIDAQVQEYIDMYDDITSAEDVYNYIATRDYMYEALVISQVYDYILSVTTVTAPTE